MSERTHSLAVKLLSLLLAAIAVRVLAIGLEGAGFFHGLGVVAFAGFLLAVAHGLSRFRGWAWLAAVVMLLCAWMVNLVRAVIGFVGPDPSDGWTHFALLLAVSGVLAYLGRWSMERRFRPERDLAPSH